MEVEVGIENIINLDALAEAIQGLGLSFSSSTKSAGEVQAEGAVAAAMVAAGIEKKLREEDRQVFSFNAKRALDLAALLGIAGLAVWVFKKGKK